ncbi:MAG: hypothetical protein HC826_01530 [Rhodospirillales bacterium]|nr:hypothetical protein [Rhodospirillales bacterium]
MPQLQGKATMTGFYKMDTTKGFDKPASVSDWQTATITRAEIDALVAKGQQARSDAIASGLRHFAQEWASLWRRPGRAIPANLRGSRQNA